MTEFLTNLVLGQALKPSGQKEKEIFHKLLSIGALVCIKKQYFGLQESFLLGRIDTSLDKKKAFLLPFGAYSKDLILKNYPQNLMRGDIILAKLATQKHGKRNGVMQLKSVAKFMLTLLQKEVSAVCVLADKDSKLQALSLQDNTFYNPKASQKSLKALPKKSVIKLNARTLEVTKVLGVFSDESIDKQICLEAHGIKQEFPKDSLSFAQSYGDKLDHTLYPDRKDYTALPFCVIDPKGAKDHDDAIFYDQKERKLFVAIADVSEYVPKDTPLDKEARNRCFSVYFPDSVVPMLPPLLSNTLCSLQENEIRLALVFEIKLQRGEIKSFSLHEGMIKSHAFLDYEQVDNLLARQEHKNIRNKNIQKCLQWLKKYEKVVKRMRTKRLKSGYDFRNPEVKVVLDKDSCVQEIALQQASISHHIIEESMLLANICAATMLEEISPLGIYRIHQAPRESKIQELFSYIHSTYLGTKKLTQNRDKLHAAISELQNFASKNGIREIVDSMIVRFFNKALYSTLAQEHFGLGFRLYTHFTSPIRRYGDLCVHRILKAHLQSCSTKKLLYLTQNLYAITNDLNTKEREIIYLQREFLDMKYARFIDKKLANNEHIELRAITIDESTPQCIALEIIPQARILLTNGDSLQFKDMLQFENVRVRLKKVDLLTRCLYGEIINQDTKS